MIVWTGEQARFVARIVLFLVPAIFSVGVRTAVAIPPDFALNDQVRSLRNYMSQQRVERCFPRFFSGIFQDSHVVPNRFINKKRSMGDIPRFRLSAGNRPSWLWVQPILHIDSERAGIPAYVLTAGYDESNGIFAISYAEEELDIVAFVRDAGIPSLSLPPFDATRIRTSDGTVTAVPPKPVPSGLGYGTEVKYRRACNLSEVVYKWGDTGLMEEAVYIYDGPTLVAFRTEFGA